MVRKQSTEHIQKPTPKFQVIPQEQIVYANMSTFKPAQSFPPRDITSRLRSLSKSQAQKMQTREILQEPPKTMFSVAVEKKQAKS